MKKKIFYSIIIFLISFKLHSLEVTLTQGTIKPTPIAVTNFYSKDDKEVKIGKNISMVISDNLERSGLFKPIEKKAFIQDEESLSNQPRFEDWKIIKAQHLIAGKIYKKNEKISVEFRLYDVFSQKQLLGKKYETSEKNWRRVSHIISDAIFERITGEGGYFDTRVVYVAETGPKESKQKRLAIMDQDQANHRFLTDGSYLVLTPRFSPNSQKITYMSYMTRNSPRVYIFDIETGHQEIVGEFPGMTFAPRFSPDGKKIIMSYADPDVGNSEIYILDLVTRISSRITNSSAIDVSASFSPDGKKIVFNSDRSGRRHLYVAESDGKNLKRISRERGSYYTPVWSPRGDMIAFTKQEGGQFYIGVMETDGSNERMIAKSFHVEGPTWAPNGRYLLYFKEERTAEDGSGGESSLYSIDLTGYNERKIITPLGGSDPAWSPLMH
ncbi:MAG: Tol-Pal system protein TolB [Pelagibacteraceae bacterium]|jgi:TolB protein|nr:Tol-Pal system protein TolB [Pelagibacteraceae bacterium]MDP6783996.1 Tol-Pal system beta propeller repeat protein TolB [Alphaproteobacteria bacterium]MBO6465831.1 Tol-Pal system protein TolB [Pelagibacteraceae bacterium]MBO6467283.1 Tol-Pal system protein TolB [Pelagibacteraceae bacterium]MBO6468760.1 Tol-Pal system protein TolB [Pelagibacteraceae bacterium]